MVMKPPCVVAEDAIDMAWGMVIDFCIMGMPIAAPVTSIAHAANAIVNTRRDRQKCEKTERCMQAI